MCMLLLMKGVGMLCRMFRDTVGVEKKFPVLSVQRMPVKKNPGGKRR